MNTPTTLYTTILHSPLGLLYAVADDHALIYFGFEPFQSIAAQKPLFRSLIKKKPLLEQKNHILTLLEQELALYFKHPRITFTVPVRFVGSPFQQAVWHALKTIPYGKTQSYKEQAELIGKPSAYRAVGNANSANNIVIVVPCHRVIASDGSLGGYAGGLTYKELLLKHEMNHTQPL